MEIYSTDNCMSFLRWMLRYSEEYQIEYFNDVLLDMYTMGMKKFFEVIKPSLGGYYTYNRLIWLIRPMGTNLINKYSSKETMQTYIRTNEKMFLFEMHDQWDKLRTFTSTEIPIGTSVDTLHEWLSHDGYMGFKPLGDTEAILKAKAS